MKKLMYGVDYYIDDFINNDNDVFDDDGEY